MKKNNRYFVEVYQLNIGKNESYFNSLFLGIVTPISNFPMLAFSLILFPLIKNLWLLCKVMVMTPLHGAKGNLISNNLTAKEVLEQFGN